MPSCTATVRLKFLARDSNHEHGTRMAPLFSMGSDIFAALTLSQAPPTHRPYGATIMARGQMATLHQTVTLVLQGAFMVFLPTEIHCIIRHTTEHGEKAQTAT